MSKTESSSVVIVALLANLGIAVAKFLAAAWTQSSAMLSEAIHSLVDTSNQILLMFGISRAKRPADAQHPFGHSTSIYFWSFIVAILLFSLGAGVAMYEGVDKLLHPHPIHDVYVLYAVLGVSLALEGVSMAKALSALRAANPGQPLIARLKSSKDPSVFAIVLEDFAALTGLAIAFTGVLFTHLGGYDDADGIASILIGLLLGLVAVFMAREIASLIVGEAAAPEVQAGIRAIIDAETGRGKPILAVNEIKTMHLGPEDVLVAASVDFHDHETAASIEAVATRIERTIKARYPEVRNCFIEVQAAADHEALALEDAIG